MKILIVYTCIPTPVGVYVFTISGDSASRDGGYLLRTG